MSSFGEWSPSAVLFPRRAPKLERDLQRLRDKPMSTTPDMPEESQTESQALKKLKAERAADAERIRQDFIRSQRIHVAVNAKSPPAGPKKDEC
jgi:hypothetical protein